MKHRSTSRDEAMAFTSLRGMVVRGGAFSWALVAACVGVLMSSPLSAQAPEPPPTPAPTGETPPAEEAPPAPPPLSDKPLPDPPVVWETRDPSGLLRFEHRVNVNEPGRDWIIRLKDGGLIRARVTGIELSTGGEDPIFGRAMDRVNFEIRWPSEGGTGLTRRYNTGPVLTALARHLGDNPDIKGARLIYNRTDRGLSEQRNVVKTPIADLGFVRLPQTWENIWLSQVVEGVPVTERLARVKAFDEAFRIRIENKAFKPEYFSIEEKAAYASFYQGQFAAIRDKTPNDPEIFRELAAYHGRRDNVDAQLSVYLDAIQNEVPDTDRQYFQFLAGELLVKRLGMYAEALPHLTSAYDFAEARLLIVEAYHRLEDYEASQVAADDLMATIEADRAAAESGGEIQLSYAEDGAPYRESIRHRAMLLKARALHVQNRFGEARTQVQELLTATPETAATNPAAANTPAVIQDIIARAPSLHDEAKLLLASMYVFREKAPNVNTGQQFDLLKMATDELTKNEKWGTYIREAVKDKPDVSRLPYDPLGCQAVCLWVDATSRAPGVTVPNDKRRALAYATMLDPLSPEPYLVLGKVAERTGEATRSTNGAPLNLYEARAAYEEGLIVAPQDYRLNYQLGVLFQRDGDLAAAERLFMAALEAQPEHYPSMNRLAEIKLSFVGGAEARLFSLFAMPATPETNREITEAGNQILRGLRECAGYLSSSLEIVPRQHAVRANLGALYARLATYYNKRELGAVDNDLARSYLQTALRYSTDVVTAFRARLEQAASSPAATVFDEVPPIEAFTVMASAAYQLGIAASPHDQTLIDLAIKALEEHQAASLETGSFESAAEREAYKNSSQALWARDALRELKARQRQKMRSESFDGLEFNSISQLGNGWSVLSPDNADDGTLAVIRTTGGKLVMGTEKQAEAGFVTRVSREESFSTLRSFNATIAPLGRSGAARGIHMTKARNAEEAETSEILWSFLVGFDEENRLFWDVRQVDATSGAETSVLPERRRVYVDASNFGYRGMTAFPADVPLTLGIEREVPDENGGTVYYYIRLGGIDGIRVPIDLGLITNIDTRNLYDSSSDLNPEVTDVAVRIGFFVQAGVGASGKMDVTECMWVVDSNLANIVETE